MYKLFLEFENVCQESTAKTLVTNLVQKHQRECNIVTHNVSAVIAGESKVSVIRWNYALRTINAFMKSEKFQNNV